MSSLDSLRTSQAFLSLIKLTADNFHASPTSATLETAALSLASLLFAGSSPFSSFDEFRSTLVAQLTTLSSRRARLERVIDFYFAFQAVLEFVCETEIPDSALRLAEFVQANPAFTPAALADEVLRITRILIGQELAGYRNAKRARFDSPSVPAAHSPATQTPQPATQVPQTQAPYLSPRRESPTSSPRRGETASPRHSVASSTPSNARPFMSQASFASPQAPPTQAVPATQVQPSDAQPRFVSPRPSGSPRPARVSEAVSGGGMDTVVVPADIYAALMKANRAMNATKTYVSRLVAKRRDLGEALDGLFDIWEANE